eukprot:m51a1_g10905 hypothetical protein (228) ;mRNA; r:55268-56419
MAEIPLGDSAAAVFLRVSAASIVRGRAFEICCLVRSDWMSANGVEPESIRSAAVRSQVHLEGAVDSPPVGPCARCCTPRKRQNVLVAPDMFCNSSRLHLGGRVVIVFQISGSQGEELARAVTEPLVLHAKTNYVPVPRTLKWKDSVVPRPEARRERGSRHQEEEPVGTPPAEATAAEDVAVAAAELVRTDLMRQIEALRALQTDQLERIRALDMALRASSSSSPKEQ